jgi:spermidine synthase
VVAVYVVRQEDVAVLPWIQLDTATIQGGVGELRLMRRGAEFSIMAGAIELMNSRVNGSEEALATLACERIRERPKAKILIGGLGMGFTLRAALASLREDAVVVVAELVPPVVAWARGPLASVFGDSLSDPRVDVRVTDVRLPIATQKSAYDAILLDVDNGPEGLTRSANDELYSLAGLKAAWSALRPEGVLAVWSSAPSGEFTRRLRAVGFNVEEVKVRANGARGGARHLIWIATNVSGSQPRIR